MPISEPQVDQVRKMKGVHLFHFGLSSCSQRVRFALEEKGVAWEGHTVDLHKMENVSREYQQIHPKGYVPALVHDGRLVTESVDIIRYIDEHFAGPSLMPESTKGIELLNHWVERADRNQWCLKTLTYELLFKKLGHFSKDEEVQYYIEHQSNPELVQFIKEFTAGFPEERIHGCLDEVESFLAELNGLLSENRYVAGDLFSIADIAVVVNVHRYKLLQISLEPYEAIRNWYERIESRPGFQKAITAFER